MALWSEVQTGYDFDEETINFGIRKVVDVDQGSFECVTLATFGSEDEKKVEKLPTILTAVTSDSLCVVIENTLCVFNSTNYSDTRIFKFSFPIQCIAVSTNDSVLFLSDEKANFYIFHLHSFKVIYTRSLIAENENFEACQIVTHLQSNCKVTAYVIQTNGTIYSIQNINLQSLDGSVDISQEVSITKYQVEDKDVKINITCAAVISKMDKLLIAGNVLALYDIHSGITKLHHLRLKTSVVSLQYAPSIWVLLAVLVDGTMFNICPERFYIFNGFNFKSSIRQCNFVKDVEDTNHQIVVYSESDTDEKRSINVYKFNGSLDIVYKFELGSVVSMVPTKNTFDDVLFLEAEYEDDKPSKILLRTITKIQPEYRLEQLLRQRKFQDAYEFAEKNKLDLQSVYIEEAKHFVTRMSTWSFKGGEAKLSAANLISLLKKIDNVGLVLQLCLNAIPVNIDQVRELLTYARSCISQIKEEEFVELKSAVCRRVQYLDTFEIISSDTCIEKWIEFSSEKCLFEIFSEYLQQRNLGSATILWARHESELLEKLQSTDVVPLLKCLEDQSATIDLFSWLAAFIPSVLSHMPHLLSNIITWLHAMVESVESKCRRNCHENALQLCEQGLNIIQPLGTEPVSDWMVHIHQQVSDPNSPLQLLKKTKNNLAILLKMKTNHGISLSMTEYTQHDKCAVCHLILTKSSNTNIENLKADILKPICYENNLDLEGILASFIENTVNAGTWWIWDKIPFEGKILNLIGAMNDLEKTLACLVAVLKVSPVPWSEKVVELVQQFEKKVHMTPLEIRNEREYLKMKLILQKYEIHETFDSELCFKIKYTDMVRGIFYKGGDDILSDALALVADHDVEDSVHSMYIAHLLDKQHFHMATMHLENLPAKMCIKVCHRILCKTKSMVSYNLDPEELSSFVAFLGPAGQLLKKAVDALSTEKSSGKIFETYSEEAKLIENKYFALNKHLISDLKLCMDSSNKKETFLKYIKNRFQDHIPTVILCAQSISQLLHMPDIECMLLLAEAACEAEIYKLATAALSCVAVSETSITKYGMESVVRIIKVTLPVFQEVAAVDNAFLPTLDKALCSLALYCNIEGDVASGVDENLAIYNILNLKNYVGHAIRLMEQTLMSHSDHDEILHDNTSRQDPYMAWTFTPIHEDCPFNVELGCQQLQQLYKCLFFPEQGIEFVNPQPVDVSTDNTMALLESANQGAYEDKLYSRINTTVQNLNMCSNDLVAFELVNEFITKTLPLMYATPGVADGAVVTEDTCIQKQLSNPINKIILNRVLPLYSLRNKCCLFLLKRAIQSRKADISLILSVLKVLPEQDSIGWIKKYITRVRYDCNYLTRATQLGIDYSCLISNKEHLPQLFSMYQIAIWGKKFQKLGISNKELMKEGGRDDAWSLVSHMILSCPNIDLSIVKMFCHDFEISFSAALLLYLEHLILSWTPDISIKRNRDGYEEIDKIDFESVAKKCQYIVTLLSDHQEELKRKLKKILSKVNAYHYEMYLCLLQLNYMIDPKFEMTQTDVLGFLMPYKRHVKPKMPEIETWLRFHADDSSLPVIANWRLPYPLFFADAKAMIEYELNLQNYKIWLKAPKCLGLDGDEICSAAVKNSTNTDIIFAKMEDWCIESRDDKFIVEIEQCVSYMRNISICCALLDYVGKRIPPGLDKLTVGEMTLQKIQVWNSESPSNISQEMEIKLTKRVLRYSTIHVLHSNFLGRSEYIALAEDPVALIEALYKDQSIILRGRGVLQHYPDINNVVNMLGPLHGIYVEKIRHNLLENWLFSEMQASGSLDESFVDVSRVWQQMDQDVKIAKQEAEDDILRARYILEAGDTQNNIDFLVGLCFVPQNHTSARVKFRALNCLLWIVPAEKFLLVTGRDHKSVREYFNTLFFLSELEQIQGHLSMRVQDFEEANKNLIIESLWRSHSQNPRAVTLMCHICIYYNTHNSRIWANLLTRMMQLNMVTELKTILPKLNRLAHTLWSPQFVLAWNKVLISSFEKVHHPLNKEEEEECVKSLVMLQSCPFLKEMNIDEIFKRCINIKRYDMAAVVLPMSSPSSRSSLLQKLLELVTYENLKISLNNLPNCVALPINQALEIIGNLKTNVHAESNGL